MYPSGRISSRLCRVCLQLHTTYTAVIATWEGRTSTAWRESSKSTSFKITSFLWFVFIGQYDDMHFSGRIWSSLPVHCAVALASAAPEELCRTLRLGDATRCPPRGAMGKYGQIIMGPAGAGKSTVAARIQEHVHARGKSLHVINLDPAAEHFDYELAVDIRDLISVEDAMAEMGLGPNGGLVFCMQYLSDNIEWLKDRLDDFGEDCYLIFDCPGQIELYSHVPVMPRLCECLGHWGFRVAMAPHGRHVSDRCQQVYQRCQRQCAACSSSSCPTSTSSPRYVPDKNAIEGFLTPARAGRSQRAHCPAVSCVEPGALLSAR